MLHIILLILKIIGIILLSILILLLIMIFCALFVPVRYQLEVTREEGEDKPPILACVKVTWLLHLINILAVYPGDVFLRARIMLFTVFQLPQKEKKKKKKARDKEKEQENVPHPEEETGQTESVVPSSECEKSYKDTMKPVTQETPDANPWENRTDTTEEAEEKNKTKHTSSLIAKIKRIIDKIKQAAIKIKDFFENIQYTIRRFCDKIKSTLDNIQYYRKVLESEPFQRSLQLCKKELDSIGRALKPDRLEADFIIGLEDPATLGEILAVWGIFYPLIGQHVRLAGDFECSRTRIEGSFYMKGKIRAFTFLKTAIRIYFNKDIKKLIKQLKKEAA